MPNSLNAAKRHRQSLAARVRNRAARSRIRTGVKKFEAAVQANDPAAAQTLYRDFVKSIDSAVRKNLCHRNAAARKKSRLYHRVVTLGHGANP